MRSVIDVCVWVSALVSPSASGAPGRIIEKIEAGRISAVVSPHLLEELAGTLTRPKLRKRISEEKAKAFVSTLARYADVVPDTDRPPARTRDPDDDYLVALALAQDAPLVSTDKDILNADLARPAVTPRELLNQLCRWRTRRGARSEVNWMLNIHDIEPLFAATTLPQSPEPVTASLSAHRAAPRTAAQPSHGAPETRPRSLSSFLRRQ